MPKTIIKRHTDQRQADHPPERTPILSTKSDASGEGSSTLLVDSQKHFTPPTDQRDSATLSEPAPSGRDEESAYSLPPTDSGFFASLDRGIAAAALPLDGREIKRWEDKKTRDAKRLVESTSSGDPSMRSHSGLVEHAPVNMNIDRDLASMRRLARYSLLIGVRDLLHLKMEADLRDHPDTVRRDEFNRPHPERPAYCLMHKVPNRTPTLSYSPDEQRAAYRNMRTCGSVWACPVCAARISEVRRAELAEAMDRATAKGWQAFMLTFTIQHEAGQSLRDVKKLLKKAYKKFHVGKAWFKIYARYGLEGSVTGKETTHGENGWHPHLHIIFFSNLAELPADEMRHAMKLRWIKCVSSAGGYCTYDSGLDLTVSTDSKFSEYPAKMGLADLKLDEGLDFSVKKPWSIARELTKSATKRGRKGGMTPLEMIAAFMTGDQRAGELWIEYYEAMKGERQLYWSRGLREKLEMPNEKTDEEIVEAEELPERVDLLELTDDIISALNKHERQQNARGQLLEIATASGGDLDAIWQYLIDLTAKDNFPLMRPIDESDPPDPLFDDLNIQAGGAVDARRYDQLHVDLTDLTVEKIGEASAAELRDRVRRGEQVNVVDRGGKPRA